MEALTRNIQHSGVYRLLEHCVGRRVAGGLCVTVTIPACVLSQRRLNDRIERAEIAHALNMLLFRDLLARVPEAELYVADKCRGGEQVFLDHGAVRTVTGASMGDLPEGRAAITRLLEPLGYRQGETYPLQRIRMTGYAYYHTDYPEELAQFFISELDTRQFSDDFQRATSRVVSSSVDPLSGAAQRLLDKLANSGGLHFQEAANLLLQLRACFERQHAAPRLGDYRVLKAESAEMAWIATEGNAYNHVTDRVPDVEALSARQRELGRPIKEAVEVSAFGSVRQTAYRASQRARLMLDDSGAPTLHNVPGSFIEFISRYSLENDADRRLDLRFDSSNAQGIFTMTATDRA